MRFLAPLIVLFACLPALAKPVVLIPGSEPAGDAPWGRSTCDSATLARVKQVIQAQGKTKSHFHDSVVIGPALWTLLGKDPALAAPPEDRSFSVQPQADGTTIKMEMRTFQGAREVAKLLRSKVWSLVAEHFAAGEVRAASDQERQLFYGEIPFEIAKVPIAVVEKDHDVLLVLLEKNRVMWMEIVNTTP